MELKKGENMIKHEAEIYSRPARTWFQTSKEKNKSQGIFHQLLENTNILTTYSAKQTIS